jgi:molecular chaperone GrpE (heat shock protein)
MTSNGWWMLLGLASLLGAFAGGMLVMRLARVRHAAHLRHTTDELQKKFAATIDQLRAAHVRAQTELEQVRNAFKQQLAAATDEPRAAAARAEQRLRAAYDELDRLRREAKPDDTARAELSDGFAATRPMRPGL